MSFRIDGEEPESITIDGETVETLSVDGEEVWTASQLEVLTHPPQSVGGTSATLEGDITDVGDYDQGELFAWFEWREPGDTAWPSTDAQEITTTGVYTDDITGLETTTEYEYRAAAGSDPPNEDAAGQWSTFTTEDIDEGEYLNLASEVPQSSRDVRNAAPDDYRTAYSTQTVSSSYEDRGGDLENAIEDASSSGALLDLGSGGEYEMNSTVGGDSVVGVVGDPDNPPRIYYNGTHLQYLFNLNVPTAVMYGVTFDITETTSSGNDTDVGVLSGQISNEGWFEHISLDGTRHRNQDIDGDGSLESVSGIFTFLVECVDSGATAYMHDCNFPDGGTNRVGDGASTTSHAIGPNSDPGHVGLNVWERCLSQGFFNNGFYLANSDGRNTVIACEAYNNSSGGIRIGSYDSRGDVVIGGQVGLDILPSNRGGQCLTQDHPNGRWVGVRVTGSAWANAIQMRSGDGGANSARNVEFEKVVLDVDGSGTPVRLDSDGNPNASITATDCYWYDQESGGSVVSIQAADVDADTDWRVLGENAVEVSLDGGTLTYDGTEYLSGDHSASDLGMEDPRAPHNGLPEFYVEFDD